MILLLTVHFVAAICAPLVVRAFGRNAFFVLAAVPASAAIWAAVHTRQIFEQPVEVAVRWVPALDLNLVFRVDVLSGLMMLIVGGVGSLVMFYSARYFAVNAPSLGRFAALFLGFAGAMLGVVMADQTMTVYVFWELTSVLSYLLIGFHHGRRPARSAARQAILVTSMGALAMFGGFVMLGVTPGGSFRISELLQNLRIGTLDVTSPLVIVAALLILLGGLTKSAQIPFHFWLPGAMAAPTPVSAYLHAAAMVKAGVYLVARLTPGFTLIPGWSQLAVVFGFSTMILGAYRALKQRDLKLILAFGTVSQLGLMTAAVGLGSASAMAAGIVIMVAHSLFKSALFLTVGAVESVTGTRDIWDLSSLRKRTPVLATFAALAALSMAGVPVTLGYLGKEGLLSALYFGTDAAWVTGRSVEITLLTILVIGSMMTAAYAWRVWWGAFAAKNIEVEMKVRRLSTTMTAPIGILAVGALLGITPYLFSTITHHVTGALPGHEHIALWSGKGPAILTAVVLAGGLTLAYFRQPVSRIQRAIRIPFSSIRGYAWTLRELELTASLVTSRIQRGSLTAEIATIFATVIIACTYALVRAPSPSSSMELWDTPLQAAIIAAGILAVAATVRANRRMRAALSLGAVGMSVSLLFAYYGAPDLALTQLAVEAVSIVVFILVLRKLPTHFSTRPLLSTRVTQYAVSIGIGLIVTIGGYFAISSRIASPVSENMPAEALSFGHGENIVNVILVDMRAWDTVGELSVLLVTATGVASLIYIMTRTGKISRVDGAKGKGTFLPGVLALAGKQRSIVLEVSTRLLFPTMLMLSLWLLFVGHNNPGGGFAGGVVAGLAFVLRYLAGGRYELGEAMPIPAGYLLGGGLFIAAAGGALPLLWGQAVFQSQPVDIALGPIGTLHFTTAMVLDIGVYILVLGLVLDLVSALGAEIDRQTDRELLGSSRMSTRSRRRSSVGGAL